MLFYKKKNTIAQYRLKKKQILSVRKAWIGLYRDFSGLKWGGEAGGGRAQCRLSIANVKPSIKDFLKVVGCHGSKK